MEDELYKEYEAVCKKSIQSEMDINGVIVNKVFALVERINKQPKIILSFLKMPELKFGVYQLNPVLITFFAQYNLENMVPFVPLEVQKEFLAFVVELSYEFRIIEYKSGFRAHFQEEFRNMTPIRDSLKINYPDLLNQKIYDNPMMKVVLALQEAK